MHGGVPSAVPRCAAPAAIEPLETEQSRAEALGGDPRAFRGNLVPRSARQIAHDLPAKGWIGIEKPIGDPAVGIRDSFEWMDCHLVERLIEMSRHRVR